LRVSAKESLEVFLKLRVKLFVGNRLAKCGESKIDKQIFRTPQLSFVKITSSMMIKEKLMQRSRRSRGRPQFVGACKFL